MDKLKAIDLGHKLAGQTVGGYRIESLINFGKSAAVYLATSGTETAAVKIFDDELILRYGDETQLTRIEREVGLVGKQHPNLVKILGGGVDTVTNNHYIIMQYVPGKNIKQCLKFIPAENIPSLVNQLASAAKFLEDLGFVHRDIKPENIVLVDNFSKLVLLDLGVLRPIAGSTLTDANGIQAFVGTLQYSSPEFLLRQEEDSVEGWRALTFYQIGGVLHDLIMRQPLFAEFAEPYARLVNAVQHVTPEIQNSAVPHYLLEIARFCLLKNWKTRTNLVQWDSFRIPDTSSSGDSAKQRVTNRGMLALAKRAEALPNTPLDDGISTSLLIREVHDFLTATARSLRAENSILPPLKILARTPTESGFGIQLGHSQQLGWTCDLTIFLSVKVLDLQSKLLEISSCACLGPFVAGQHAPDEPKPIFQGTYDAATLSTLVENCIYGFIDQTQRALPQSADICWLQPSDEV